MSEEKKTVVAELNDEQLDQVTGGNGWVDAGMGSVSPQGRNCPDCYSGLEPVWQGNKLVCPACGHIYKWRDAGVAEFSAADDSDCAFLDSAF